MGCQQSTTSNVEPDPWGTARTEDTASSSTKKPSSFSKRLKGRAPQQPPKGIGHTERLMSAEIKRLQEAEANNKVKGVVSLEADEEVSQEMPKLNANGQLMPEEVVRRTSSSLIDSIIRVGKQDETKGTHSFQIKYAHWRQRGYYPDDPLKANQDEFGITLRFAGEEGDSLFAVYDGHGAEGHKCAKFAKTKLPTVLAKHIRRQRVQSYQEQLRKDGKPAKGAWNPALWPFLTPNEYEQCCHKTFREVNQAMHDDDEVDDKFSGTTAATVSFHGGRMTVCNVGDSRVIVGHRLGPGGSQSPGEETKEEEKCELDDEDAQTAEMDNTGPRGPLLPIPLSRDQTPYRKDERERVRLAGADVKSIDQIYGSEEMHDDWGDMVLGERVDIQGDPPRVWVKDKEYPGTAFTRSLGDSLAEEIGVNAEPEIITTHLTCFDEFIVIASDGIFEFLTNQQVTDICDMSSSPLQACELLVKTSYDKWLEYENRTDDITVIVLFISSKHKPAAGEAGTTNDLVDRAGNYYGSKPLRFETSPRSDPDKIIASEKVLDETETTISPPESLNLTEG